MPIFMKFSNCRIVIVQTTNFETIQYDKIHIPRSLVCVKTSYNEFCLVFLENISILNFVFLKMTIFLKLSNCHIITHQITYFKNIKYDKIYFPCRLICGKTSYKEFASFFWEIFPFQISIF